MSKVVTHEDISETSGNCFWLRYMTIQILFMNYFISVGKWCYCRTAGVNWITEAWHQIIVCAKGAVNSTIGTC